MILQEMLVYINAPINSPASNTFSLPISFLQRFSVFSCGQATQANTGARARGLGAVDVGIQWNYIANCAIYVFAIGL